MKLKCSDCLIKKTTDSFHLNRISKRGFSYKCKDCTRIKDRNYNLRCPEKTAETRRKWNAKNPEKRKIHRDRARKKFPEKELARQQLKYAVRSGKKFKPETCFDCSKKFPKPKLMADHHKGYDKKNWLNVQFICAKCDGIRRRKW